MYIVKNAFKSIGRSAGRNILIGIIVVVIAASACVGLSIRQAAENAKKKALENLSVTARISMNMSSIMNSGSGFNKEDFFEKSQNLQSLSLEDLQKYAKADSVSGFYYTETLNLDGSDSLEPVTNSTSTDTTDSSGSSDKNSPPMGENGGRGGMPSSDFTVIGYSSDKAMTDFVSGTSKVTDGECFAEQTDSPDCIISSELATFNSIAVGNTITLTNPNNSSDVYSLKVVGIYEGEDTSENTGFQKGAFNANDPTNRIYISAAAAEKIAAASSKIDADNAVTASTSGTYLFNSVSEYEKFDSQARTLGLSDDYTISSSDITAYEQSLVPIETLSKFAKYFLVVVIIIGAVILVVLNLFNIRERKYEVGVLTAIGMKKRKVALQFLTEVFAVTMAAVIIGGAAGAVSSLPITNALLANQVASEQSSSAKTEQSFGRGGAMTPTDNGSSDSSQISDAPDNNGGGMQMIRNFGKNTANYVSEVSSATNITVLLELLAIAIGLTLIASAVSIIFIMRYDPLKILANRD